MLVLLDTNHVFDDPFLTRPSLLALLRHRVPGDFDVAVPAVVVEEAVRQYDKHLAKRPERGPQELATADDVDPPPAGDPFWLERYEQRLVARLVELGVAVLAEPPSDEIQVWRRQRRKPFKDDACMKDGDARIWATALEAAAGERVILVSRNHKDFGHGEANLAPELRKDLDRRGLPEEQVVLRHSIVHALGDLGAPHVARAETADLLERGRGKRALLNQAMRAMAARLLDDDSAALLGLDVELDPETVYVEEFETIGLEVTAAFQVADEIAVEASVYGNARIDVLVYRPDAYALPDDSLIRIHDYDFNESYAEGQADLQIEVILETTVDSDRNVTPPSFVGARSVSPDAAGPA